MKISKKDKKQLEKALQKELKENDEIIRILKSNKNNPLKLKMKIVTFIDPKTKKKSYGGVVELYETKSNKKIFDGWNIDLGATIKGELFAGISKDFYLFSNKNKKEERAIGGYVDVIDTSKKIWNKFKKGKDIDNIKIKIGISRRL